MKDELEDSGIVGTGLSPEAEQTLFPVREEEGGKHKVTKEESVAVSEGPRPNMAISSPAHLWNLGAFKLRFVVRNLQEAAAMVGQCQELFRNLEKGYGDRIEEVEEVRNRVSLAQIEVLEDLADQLDKELPEGLEEMSKTTASKLISEWMQEAKGGNDRSSSRRRPRRSSSRSSRSSRRTRRSSSSRRSSRRSSRSGDDPITSAQKRYIRRLCEDLDIDDPDGLDDMTKAEASDCIQDLEAQQDE